MTSASRDMTSASREAGLALTLAVVTYHRTADLGQLLPMLIAQAALATDDDGPVARCDILVVDNDPEASAREIVAAHDNALVRYVIEPKPGIAAARNRALAESARSDLLVFIDDDERPSESWLVDLIGTWATYRVAAVTGPVRSELDRPLDPWLAAGGIFARRHRADTVTGSALAEAATNNLLLDLRRIRAHGLRFADDLGLSSGKDSLFTRSIVAAGEQIIWCAEAVVIEKVRPDRLSRRWMLMRAFSYGSADCQVDQALASGRGGRLAARLHCFGAGVARVGYGAARAALGVVTRSLRHQALGALAMMRGAGLVAGSFGYAHQRYRAARR